MEIKADRAGRSFLPDIKGIWLSLDPKLQLQRWILELQIWLIVDSKFQSSTTQWLVFKILPLPNNSFQWHRRIVKSWSLRQRSLKQIKSVSLIMHQQRRQIHRTITCPYLTSRWITGLIYEFQRRLQLIIKVLHLDNKAVHRQPNITVDRSCLITSLSMSRMVTISPAMVWKPMIQSICLELIWQEWIVQKSYLWSFMAGSPTWGLEGQ